MKVLSVQDHSMAVSKLPMLGLFANVGTEGSRGMTWQVDAVFPPNEPLVDVLTCTRVVADAEGGMMVASVYGMPQVLVPAASLRQGARSVLASQRERARVYPHTHNLKSSQPVRGFSFCAGWPVFCILCVILRISTAMSMTILSHDSFFISSPCVSPMKPIAFNLLQGRPE